MNRRTFLAIAFAPIAAVAGKKSDENRRERCYKLLQACFDIALPKAYVLPYTYRRNRV